MRDIKFRFWDKRVNKFRYDLLISNANQYEGLELDHVFANKVYDIYNDYGGMFSSGLVKEDVSNHVVVQQYTGLKDENGVEIYEGDLLTYRSFTTIYLVDFNNENYGYVMGWNLLEYGYFKDGIFSECEKVEYSNSNTVNYPVSEYYYGLCPTNNEIDGLDPYYEVVGNIFEGVDK